MDEVNKGLEWLGVIAIPIMCCVLMASHYANKACDYAICDWDRSNRSSILSERWGRAAAIIATGWLIVLFIICLRLVLQI